MFKYTFKYTFKIGFTLALILSFQTTVSAWEQHQLPTAFSQSSTAHYGGNKAPLVLSANHIKTVAANAQGLHVWDSLDDGITWTSSLLSSQKGMNQAYLANENLAVAWGNTNAPVLFQRAPASGSWSGSHHVWPLANWNIVDVNTSTTGHIIILATTPAANKLVEGALYAITAHADGWSTPALISPAQALVADASVVIHRASGLQSIVWSQRNGNAWEIMLSNSHDNTTWNSPIAVVQHIAAPYFQEAGVHIAADVLNENEIALAFTGWSMQAHSQVWSKAVDAVSGVTTHALSLLPDAGDMVHQPSLVVLSSNTWAVAWQQKIGIDSEIYVAQHEADGTWTKAVNVSSDANHMDRDPHIALGASHTLNVAFTRRMQADVQEVYTFSEGDIHDSSLDSDGDGIADSQEIGFDLDGDGIDDAFSARVATWRNADGRYALVMLGNGELSQVQAPSFAETGINAPHSYQVSGSLFSFHIEALHIGETTQVHLITPNTLDDDVTWLKLNQSQWADSQSNTVFHDDSNTGLIIRLTDGGAGDEDGISNGIIVDPAVLATPKSMGASLPQAGDTTGVETGEITEVTQGCFAAAQQDSPWLMMIMLMVFGLVISARYPLKLNHFHGVLELAGEK